MEQDESARGLLRGSVRCTLHTLPGVRFQTETISGGAGRAKNVSIHGLAVLTDRIPAVGESVLLLFQDDTYMWIGVCGVVRWIREQTDESRGRGFGVELEAPPPEYRAFVDRLLERDKRFPNEERSS